MNLNKIIKPSVPLRILYIVLGFAVWTVVYIGTFYERGVGFDQWSAGLFDVSYFYKNLVSLVFTLINGALLLQLFNRFSFVNTRTFVPAFVFGLLMAVWYTSHALFLSHIALFLFICALFCFFNMSEKPTPEKSFLGSLLIACASLLVNPLILILPACWLGFVVLRCFSFRIFLASVLGVLAVGLLYAAANYVIFAPKFFSWHDLFYLDFYLGFCIRYLQLPLQIYIGSLLVLFFITIFGTYADFHKQANNIRRNINFILILLVCFIALFAVQRDFKGTFFPFIALCFSVFASHLFSAKTSKFYTGLFFIFIIINAGFVAYLFIR